jgi:general secretion pathway protein G
MGRAQSGFTLVELAVTAAIVGVLAAGALPLAEIAVKRGKELELRHALRQMRGAIDEYRAAVEAGRVKRQPTESGYPKSLEALVEGVPDTRAAGARIYFLRRIPRDPFADPGLAAGATWGRRSYASPPEAPREGDDVYDVYALSAATGLNGVPYRRW